LLNFIDAKRWLAWRDEGVELTDEELEHAEAEIVIRIRSRRERQKCGPIMSPISSDQRPGQKVFPIQSK